MISLLPNRFEWRGRQRSRRPRRGIERLALARQVMLLAATMMFIAAPGCVTESVSKSSADLGGMRIDPTGDLSEFELPTVKPPAGYRSENIYRAALVAPLGEIDVNGQSLPIVNPAGGYFAVQQGPPVPWDTVLARKESVVPYWAVIAIYRVKQDESTGRLTTEEIHRLRNIGLLGRSADNRGFLIEAPQDDGSRWIGKVSWTSGQVEWLVQNEDVNAFAAIGPGGNLAWCRRAVDDERFDLVVERGDATLTLDSGEVGKAGEWLMPVWAGDGQTLFLMYQSHNAARNEGLLEVVAVNASNQELLNSPMMRRPLVEISNRYIAYQALASIQDPIPWDQTARMIFYHPGFGRVCLLDPARAGIVRYLDGALSGAWSGENYLVLSTNDAVYAQDLAAASPPIELFKGAYIPRRTASPLHPYLLFGGRSDDPRRMSVWAMQVINDPEMARAAERVNGDESQ